MIELKKYYIKKDMMELGKSEFGKLVRCFIFDNLGSYKRLGPAKFGVRGQMVSFCWRVAVSTSMAQNNLDMFFNVAEPSQRFIFIYFVNFSVVNYFQ